MSTTVDDRVVSMKFDNSDFEKNVKTTMGTLDKFNNKLKFDGVAKGVDTVNAAAKKIDLSGMSGAAQAVQAKFSALEVAGVTVMASITNSAFNMGKRIMDSFTLAPIMSGFSEYETKMNAIQTVMSNTASKGTTMADVTAVLDELNTYADKTIYNFAEMTRNVGTFTAAGVGLKESAAAIQGIANLAASSGSNAQQASTAMYQLSQALATGTVRLMDWNSVVNAGMGGEKFQEALKATAREHGIAVDDMIKANGSFRDSLETGWLSADVLNETLNKFTLDGAKKYAQSMLESGKYTQEQADALVAEAQSMEDAATKVKTFTQLMDTLKEATQSGWAKTWEIVFGNFTEAKDLFTDLSDTFGGMIQASADARNNLLADTLSSKWDVFAGKIKLAGISTDDLTEKIKETSREHNIDIDSMISEYGSLANAIDRGKLPAEIFTESLRKIAGVSAETVDQTSDLTGQLQDFQKVVDDVWFGTYKNGEERIKALADAGYDYASVQNLVNNTVDGHRLTLEELTGSQLKSVAMTQKMSDAQLASIGFTDEQVSSLRDLADQAEQTGTPINDLIQSMIKPTGRTLLVETLKNLLQAIIKPIQAVKKAWDETFSADPGQLYGLIEMLNNLSKKLVLSDDNADKLSRTFKGLFSIFKIVSDIVGGGLNLAFKLLSPVIGTTSFNILDITAAVGDSITKFKDLIEQDNLVAKGFEKIGDFASYSVGQIKKWIGVFEKLPIVQKGVENFKTSLLDFKDVGKNIIEGLKNGILDDSKSLPDLLVMVGNNVLTAIKKVLGIHSPSTEMYNVGTNIIAGLINGIKDGLSLVLESASDIGNKIKGVLNDIPWGTVFAGGITAGALVTAGNLSQAVQNFSEPAKGLGEIFESTAKVVDKFAKVEVAFSKVMNGFAFSLKMEGVKKFAEAIAILVGSIVALTLLDQGKLETAVMVIGVLAGIMIAVMVVADQLSKSNESFAKGTLSSVKLGTLLVALSVSLLILAKTVSILGSMNTEQAEQGFIGLAGIVMALSTVLVVIGTVARADNTDSINKFGKMMLKLSISLLLMAVTVKLLGSLSIDEIKQGGGALIGLAVIMGTLAYITNLVSEKTIDQFSTMMSKLGISLLLMSVAVKILGSIPPNELNQGMNAIAGLSTIMGLFAVMTSKFGDISKMEGLGKVLTAISISLVLMAGVIKLLGSMDLVDIVKGELALSGLTLLMRRMVDMVKSFEKDAPKVSLVLLSLSLSIGLMAISVAALSLIDLLALAKGVIAVSILGVVMKGMIEATKDATKCAGTITAMSVAIAIISASLVALSFLDPLKLAGAVGALSVVMGMFALVIKSSGDINGGMKELIVMTVAIGVIAGALAILSSIPTDKLIVSALALGGILLAITVSMKLLSSSSAMNKEALLGLGAMMLVFSALSGALYLLAQLPITSVIASATALSIVLLALAGSMKIISGIKSISISALASMAAMMAVIAALALLMGVMVKMSGMSWSDVTKGLVVLAGVFITIGAAGLLLGPVTPIITALAVAIALIGGAMLAAGAGMLLFATSTTLLAVGLVALGDAFTLSGAAITGGLTLMLTSIIGLIPLILVELGNGLIALCGIIAIGAPAIAQAAVSVVVAIITALTDVIPALTACILLMLTTLLKQLADSIPQMVEAGMKLVVGILTGVADHIQEVVEMGILIIVNFIKGVSDMLPDVIDAGFKLIISFINGLADGIRANKDELIDAIINLFLAVIEAAVSTLANAPAQLLRMGREIMQNGLIQGIIDTGGEVVSSVSGIIGDAVDGIGDFIGNFEDMGINCIKGFVRGVGNLAGKAADAVKDAVGGTLNAAKNFLGIHSPSKAFGEIGKFSILGLAKGLNDFADKAADAATGVGKVTLNAMENTLANISDKINSTDTSIITPTIRPVLDLSNIQNGNAQLNSLMTSREALDFSVQYNDSKTQSAIDFLTSAVNKLTSMNDNGDLKVVNAINTLQLAMADIKYQLANQQIVMDSGELVGSVITKVDEGLGQISVYKGRVN